MSPIRRRVPVVIGLTLTAVVGAGTATATARQAAPQRLPTVFQAATTVTVSAVTVSRPRSRAGTTQRPRPRHRRAVHRVAATRHAVARAVVTRHRTTASRRGHHPAVSGPTGWPALDSAIARIPTYRPEAAIWIVSNKYGYWGTADWYHDLLYVAPGVPTSYLYDVAVHEWSHELSVLDYAGDVDTAVRAMNASFGGTGLTGAERAADCMAILQGATWTHYTSCGNPSWRRAAARLVAGQRL